MQDFTLFFSLGMEHILSWSALDHLLFITALAIIFSVREWKNVLILVTAFTIGHSVTLALSAYNVLRLNDHWVEFFIPCTILITSASNFFSVTLSKLTFRLHYMLALVFGLIHGMGFANTIRFMLSENQKIALPLFSFNVGLEVGQIIVVSFLLFICWFLVQKIKVLSMKWWIIGISAIIFSASLMMCIERLP